MDKTEVMARIMSRRRIDPKTGCWIYTGKLTRAGYAKISVNNVEIYVHRVSAHLWRGFDIRSALDVCHSCDVPSCFNPQHLFSGTAKDNVADAISKGRFIRGERVGSSKLTEGIVHRIRKDHAVGLRNKDLVVRYKMSAPTISEITLRRTWKHI